MKIYVFETGKSEDIHVAANDSAEAWWKLRDHYQKNDRQWSGNKISLRYIAENGVVEVCD